MAQTTFNNAAAITIPASGTGNANPASPATPYPSNIVVSGMSGSIIKVTVSLNGLSHTATNDIDMLLVGPTGAKIIFLSDIGGGSGTINITFDDAAATQAANPLSSGTFRPVDVSTSAIDNFPAPAPAVAAADEAAPGFGGGGTATFASKFAGTAPNGTWSLYVVDDVGGDIGSISGGWSLTVTSGVPAAPTTTILASSQNPSFTTAPSNSVTFTSTTTVTSSGVPVTTGTVTFADAGVTIAGPLALNGSGQASFTTSTLTEGNHLITASYSGTSSFVQSSGSLTQIVNNHTNVSGNMYCNPGSIAIPITGMTSGVAQPYPSNIYVSGVGGTISKVTVQLNGFTHNASPDDVDLLLVGPGGQNVILMSDAGGAVAVSGLNINFDDAAASFLPDGGTLASGTFRPSNYNSGTDTWNAPAPAPSGSVLLSAFNGGSANGTWALYAIDDAGGDIGSIASWCLTIISGAVPSTTTTLSSSQNPSFTTAPNNVVTFTATVTSSGNPVPSGTVTFTEGFTTLSGPTAVNGSGQATFTTSALPEGTHSIVATYNGNVNFAQSSATLSQEVNTHTVVTGGNMFCNPGTFTIPGSGNNADPAMPYPSNIFVTGLSGNVAKVTVKINGFGHANPDDVDIMLVGPTGQNITLMSDAGGTTAVSGLNFTFDDAAASSLPDGPTLTSGTFKPSNYAGGDTWPSPAPASSGGILLSAFNGSGANGTWKLYVYDDAGGDAGSITSGWCLIFGTLPGVTLQPANQNVCAGNNATFTSTADGFPAPTVQWQFSTDNGMNWNNIGGATNTTLTFVTTIADNGKQYRAVFTNSNGSTNSNAATLTVASPNASFAYSENGYCQLGSDPTPVIYGTPGGTFSGPGQVSLNAGTGKIDVSASTAGGPYTITYNIGGACPASATFQVSIVNCLPGATMTDAIIIDNGTLGSAEPNDRVRLTTTITNAQAANYEGVQMMLNSDPRVTFVAGSFKSTPVAVNDQYVTTLNTALVVPLATGVLQNDFDDNIPGLSVTAHTNPAQGTVAINANGSFTYTPNNGFTGNDTFTYTITDSDMQTNTGTVKIHVQ